MVSVKTYYTKDQLIGTITTDGTGIAELDNLPLGKYYIIEKKPPMDMY